MMNITVYTDAGSEFFVNTDHAIGASGSYPYWVIWEQIDSRGNQKVTFIPKERITKVEMYGPPEDGEKPDLKVIPFERGKESGPI